MPAEADAELTAYAIFPGVATKGFGSALAIELWGGSVLEAIFYDTSRLPTFS